MTALQKRALALKKEKNALILAHYYQTMDIQEIADHVCDSFEMARRARETDEGILVICGVLFMAEAAKILNPGKTVLLPSPGAGCPMADMVKPDDVIRLRGQYPDAAVVCYVNSSAAVKAVSDVCCTSSSAVNIARALPEKRIIFIPDRNLGAYVASQVPEKDVILFDGCCPIHDRAREGDVIHAKNAHPGAKLLAHPECRREILCRADYIGSTAGIIKEALESDGKEFIIGTEIGVIERLGSLAPDKRFYPLTDGFICEDMKKTLLTEVVFSLENTAGDITLNTEILEGARRSLDRMIELG